MFLTDYVEGLNNRDLQSSIDMSIRRMMLNHDYKVLNVTQSNVVYNSQVVHGQQGLSCILTYKIVRRD